MTNTFATFFLGRSKYRAEPCFFGGSSWALGLMGARSSALCLAIWPLDKDKDWHKWAMKKWAPGPLGDFVGDEILSQLCGDYFTNHEIRIPSLNNQDSMESIRTGFCWRVAQMEASKHPGWTWVMATQTFIQQIEVWGPENKWPKING